MSIKRLLLPGRERLSRRAISYWKVCGGFGTPRSRSAGRSMRVIVKGTLRHR